MLLPPPEHHNEQIAIRESPRAFLFLMLPVMIFVCKKIIKKQKLLSFFKYTKIIESSINGSRGSRLTVEAVTFL